MIVKTLSPSGFDRGQHLSRMPYRDLSSADLAEVYAYLLLMHGPQNPRVRLPMDELDRRDKVADLRK